MDRLNAFFLSMALLALSAGLSAAAPTFPVSKANINNGTVMPISPRWPFPQFLEYNFGKSLANTPPDGMNHAEMEAQTIRAYLEMTKRFSVVGGWKPAALPNRLHYNSNCNCSEGNGYALLAAALMGDKDTFDGFWIHMHQWIPEAINYDIAALTIQNPTYGDGSRCSAGHLQGVYNSVADNSAADGDVDIAQALLIAWKQWGDNSGYNDAGGRPISYRTEFINYTRGMAGFTENPMMLGTYWGGIIGIDGYQKGGDSFREETEWAIIAAHPPKYPQAVGNCSSGAACNNFLSYLAPGYMHCFKSEWDALGDTVIANQFWRNAFSSRDIIRQLNNARTPWSVGTDCYNVDDSGVATFSGDWSTASEGIRTPMRNALDYLWHGQPAYRWDPVTHEVLAGGPGVNIQRTMASRFSQLMWDPRQAPASNPTFSAATGLNFWGPSQSQVGITQNGTMSTGNHIPVVIGPSAMAACAADDLDTLSGVPGRQLTLMKNLWRECFLVWDKQGSSYDGSVESKANGFTPAYFHDWFRLQGMLTLGGNYHSPCDMVPQANVKIYKSVDKTFAFAGDTLTYWLNLRNYGSVTATNVVVTDALPPELQYVSSTPAGSAAGQNLSWSLGTLSGLQNANVAPTLRGITVVAQVRTTVPSGTRLCNVAQVALSNGPGWTSNEFPNEESLVFKRNCVDIANRALSISKTANVSMATFGNTITYTLSVTSDSNAGWIDGGRPQVIPNFAAQLEGFGPMRLCYSLKSEATEPLIDFGNYRFSFFFEDFLYGGSGGPLTTQSYMIDANHNPVGGRTLADFTFFSEDITPGSDANGRWNRRYVYKMFSCLPDGCQNEHYTRKYHNNIGLNWQYGDLASPNYAAVDVYPTADQNRPTTLWATNAWSWMPGMAEVNYGTNPPEPLPISPDWTDGDPATPGVFNNLFDTFAVETHTPYDRVLVEEWDGYVWRRVYGNGPVPNRDLTGVVVTDVLPPELNWGGVAADSEVAGSYNAGDRTVTFNVGNLLTNQVRTLKFWATVKPDGTGVGQFNYGSFPYNSVNDGCAVADSESQVCDDATVQILDVTPPTPTPTPGDLTKSANPPTVATGGNVTYNLSYRNTKGSYYMNDATAFTDWTNSGYSTTAGYFHNATAGGNRVDNNVALMNGGGPITVEWDLRGENYQWFGVQFLNNGTNKNGFWIDIFASDPGNAKLNVYRDGTLLPGGGLTGVPPAGDFTLRAVWAGGNLTLFLNGLQIYTVATTLPAGAGSKVGMHNGDISNSGGSMFHRLYEMRVWTDLALNLRLWDTLPACLTYVSANPAPASEPAVGANGVVSWGPVAQLAPNALYSVTVVAQVTGACACGPLMNIGVGQPRGIAAQESSAGVTVSCGGTPTFTMTRTPSITPSATPTATPSPSQTPSASPSVTRTVSPSPSITPSASPSISPSPTFSFSLTATPTPSPSGTGSATPSATPTHSPSPTATITFLDTYTVSPTITLTATPSPTPSATPSATLTRSPTPSFTATPSQSPLASATDTPSATLTATPSGTRTDTPTATPSRTNSPIYTATPTPSITPTGTPSGTRTDSPTATPTSTHSPIYSPTASPSVTPTATPSATPSVTHTWTYTATPSATRTHSATLTASPTASFSATVTGTFTRSATATETARPTACAGPGVVTDGGFENVPGVVVNPGTTNYYGGWTVAYGGVNPAMFGAAAPRSGSRAQRLGWTGIFPLADRAIAYQDVCVSTACPVRVCAWVLVQPGETGSMVLDQIDAAGNILSGGIFGAPIAATGVWQQVCRDVGDAAMPYLPGMAALRIGLEAGFGGGPSSYADFDDVTLSAICPSPTPTATITPTPSISPTYSVSPTKIIQFYQQPELIEERGVFPNPFVEKAHIYFSLRVAAEATLTVYNVAGEPLFIRRYPGLAGKNEILWDGDNDSGQRCASGVYILRLQAEGVDRSSGGYWTQVVIQR